MLRYVALSDFGSVVLFLISCSISFVRSFPLSLLSTVLFDLFSMDRLCLLVVSLAGWIWTDWSVYCISLGSLRCIIEHTWTCVVLFLFIGSLCLSFYRSMDDFYSHFDLCRRSMSLIWLV